MLCGVSGGADSTALLHLLHEASIPVAAAHVNYGLRGAESDADEKFVSEFCATRSIPFYIKKSSSDELYAIDSNLQKAARDVRYSFFDDVCVKEAVSWIAVAHTSDDQLETILINFLRGSGLRGMQGMSFVNGNRVRPLLDIPRDKIETYLRSQNISWRNDSSNDSDNYLRNRVRHHVVPAMNLNDERNQSGWKHTVEQFRESKELLSGILDSIEFEISSETNGAYRISKLKLQQKPASSAILNYLLDKHQFGFHFSKEQFADLISQQPGKHYYNAQYQLIVDRDDLLVTKRTQIEQCEFVLERGEKIGEWSCLELPANHTCEYSDLTAYIALEMIDGPIVVRAWREGESMRPLGFDGTKKVSDILTELKIPLHEKSTYPIVTCNSQIVWIPGYRIAEKYRVLEITKKILCISRSQ